MVDIYAPYGYHGNGKRIRNRKLFIKDAKRAALVIIDAYDEKSEMGLSRNEKSKLARGVANEQYQKIIATKSVE